MTVLASHQASAQENRGYIIIARDVPVHNVTIPTPPGQTIYVHTAPDLTPFQGALGTPLPLSDQEAASIVGSRPETSLFSSIPDLMASRDMAGGQHSQAAPVGGGQGGFAGGISDAIGAGTSAIQQTLSSIGPMLSPGGAQP